MFKCFRAFTVAVWAATVFAGSAPAAAGDLTLAWDRNPEPNVSYIIMYGTEPGKLLFSVDVGTELSGTVTNLIDGLRYYFAVYAYTASGISDASTELSAVVQPEAAPALPPAPMPPPECRYELSSHRTSIDASAQAIEIAVATGETCAWTAASAAAWLTADRATETVGSGSIEIKVAGKRALGSRTAEVSIGSSTVVVTQSGNGSAQSRGWDFDGDGRADISVWRPDTGNWYVRRSTSPTTAAFDRVWGAGKFGDHPVPGDYDGDGRGDLAVWRESAGSWKVLQSSSNFADYLDIAIGGKNDVAMPADYDGDGRTDAAVWHPANGTWSVKTSSTQFARGFSYQWGTAADLPVTGDFDGDGKADIGLWRPTEGLWSIRLSHVNFATSHILAVRVERGSANAESVVADFDGDGASDLAVWSKPSGAWRVFLSQDHFSHSGSRVVATMPSVPGDRPVAADYDGDGKADIAVWRRSTNLWEVLSSAGLNSVESIEFGRSAEGDLPITR